MQVKIFITRLNTILCIRSFCKTFVRVTVLKMSLVRAALVVIQAFANASVCSPPNPTSQKQRYHTEQMFILRIAPAVFKCHTFIAYLCAIFEVLFYLRSTFTASMINTLSTLVFAASKINPSLTLPTLICPAQSTISETSPLLLRLTPTFLLGVLAVLLGAFIRQDCFKTLGSHFTFELTIQQNHRLVTRGFYAYVRHPSYTGAMLLVFGLALTHLTRGSWMTECGPLAWTRDIGGEAVRIAVWASWWFWMLCVAISRADAEDHQLSKVFHEEWDAYAQLVPWWFMPGLI